MKSKYNSLSEWRKADVKAYEYARVNNLFTKICDANGWEPLKQYSRWSYEKCKTEALKYNTKKEWRSKSVGSYNFASKNGWFDELCAHMTLPIPREYWTLETCKAEALKYKTKTEWTNKSHMSHEVAKLNNWIDECTAHMSVLKIKWDYEKCKKEADKYTQTKLWRENSLSSYNAAKKYGWFDELSKNMIKNVIFHDYWTLETCKEDALKYKTKTEWAKNSNSAYKTSIENGWYDECTAHMEVFFSPRGYWTKERCLEEALKYKVKEHWKKGHNKSYSHAMKNGWVAELSTHMVEGCKPRNYWTYELCKSEALKYKVKEHWKKGSPQSYQAAGRNGWYHELTTHMIEVTKPNGYWTKERCIKHAKNFNTVSEWLKANSTPCTNARLNGWYDECTAHMVRVQVPSNYWKNKKKCLEEALKYKTISEWAKNSSASYTSARKNGWCDECTAHMIKLRENRKPSGYWNKEHCLEEALKYNTKKEWRNKCIGSYESARKNGWLDECCTHMENK